MVLKIHEPEAAMAGQIIRISIESENDAAQAADLLKGALQKAVKVEWP